MQGTVIRLGSHTQRAMVSDVRRPTPPYNILRLNQPILSPKIVKNATSQAFLFSQNLPSSHRSAQPWLAPEIVEEILDGRQPAEVTLQVLMKAFPVEWACPSFSRRCSNPDADARPVRQGEGAGA
jgi:hypothetical protein